MRSNLHGKVATAFGVPMMMKGATPLASRQSFIVKDGKIAGRRSTPKRTVAPTKCKKRSMD